MEKAQQTDRTPTPVLHAALLRYMQDEERERREALREEVRAQVAHLEQETGERAAAMLTRGRADFQALRSGILSSAVGRARGEAESITLKQMGAAMERVKVQCREGLQKFAASDGFAPVLRLLLVEAARHAEAIRREAGLNGPVGDVRTAPEHAGLCRAIVQDEGLGLQVKEDASVQGGVELVVAGTTYRIRNTLFSRMDRMEDALGSVVARRLQAALSEEQPA